MGELIPDVAPASPRGHGWSEPAARMGISFEVAPPQHLIWARH